MSKTTLSDVLRADPVYAAFSWRDHEAQARYIASVPALLRRRLNEAKACLLPQYGTLFKNARFDFQARRLVLAGGEYALQWLTRERPDLPEDYDNQQTNTGTAVLLRYGHVWKVGTPVMVIDRASGEESYGTIRRASETLVHIDAIGEIAAERLNIKTQAGREFLSTALDILLSDGATLSLTVGRASDGNTPDQSLTVIPLD